MNVCTQRFFTSLVEPMGKMGRKQKGKKREMHLANFQSFLILWLKLKKLSNFNLDDFFGERY